MDYFNYKDGQLYAENMPVAELAARFGTPLYIYSRATIERHWHAFDNALSNHPHLICYATKANSNLAFLNILARLGSGFDIVSQGELERVLAAGGDPAKVIFSGVAKTEGEMRRALEVGIRCFNVESIPELHRLNSVAGDMGLKAPISLRINPDVDAKTHPYISTGLKENKFGISYQMAREAYRLASTMENINIQGVDCHIGSQLTELSPFLDAADRMLVLLDQLAEDGITIHHLDLGGGLGVRYDDETPPEPMEYATALLEKLKGRENLELCFEPGRAIAANAGIMVTQVEYLKDQDDHHFAIVDAGMNDLIRPSLYEAWMKIIPVIENGAGQRQVYDVVGPVCETGDFLGKKRELSLNQGDLLAVRSAGAYGFSMSSNYNTRCRAAEVMVDGDQAYLVRERERFEDLWRGEHLVK
ncbi:diaminopimelate decarboxylase [Pragia fontium]|uniref:Diaminopimelate decarboxylase n=2 Tax=Pragia fontium TaxID=82985 RepID=A0AAJ5BIH0_9GAMM|nr:diaminopimelate decarboxylase [Pragia fontium]AKJ43646.1 diaminopimelate decarboxylase [Pragia fontium]SFD35032.1 diaminopimelate decarboxylase [Pragia fontium DSM 5563 = ATCC 49100]SUB84142.1 Diaminopimelate decarboxylase [Pragia fontium]VEJ57034.1 Diaminopimelate decarboxylase [Pragia fontium]GKX64513.1 diaminopimelate decarboxylase [Pragia fontium]